MPATTRRTTFLRAVSRSWLGIGVFAVAAAEAIWVAPPFSVGAVGSDSTSTVLYFDRIVSGEQLELFLGTTPKPLLSLVYGPLYFAFHDWRPISWAAILAYGLAISAAALLVGRVSRSRAAGCFTATGLLASTGLLQDVSLAYAVSWALLGWSLAGLAATAKPRRYALAGAALMLAGLARQETLIITVLAGACIGAAWLRARVRGETPPRRAWLVMIGLLALPIGALHDWLLTRDPFYSFAIPALGSAIRAPQYANTAARILTDHIGPSIPLLLLAIVGLAALSVRRAWPPLIGLVALGPGVAAFLLYLGARHTYLLERYALPVDIAIVTAAGIGLAALAALAVPVLAPILEGSLRARSRGVFLAVAAVGVALALAPTVAPLDETLLHRLDTDRQLVADFQSAAPTIEKALRGISRVRDMPSVRNPDDVTPPAKPALLLPARVYPMAAVQFELPLTQVARLEPSRVNGTGSYPSAGQIVMHDRMVDLPASRSRFMEVDRPTREGLLRLVPLLANPLRGLWVLRIEPQA
ncbi:MAG: hypothetical protein ABJB65_01460 [Chloroflexota bacterium]